MNRLPLIIIAFNLVYLSFPMEIGSIGQNLTEIAFLEDNMKTSIPEPEFPINSNTTFFVDGTKGYFSGLNNQSLYACYKRPRTEIMNLYSRFALDVNYNLKEMEQQFSGALGIGLTMGPDTKINGQELDVPLAINIGLNFNFKNFFSESKFSSYLYYYSIILRRRTFNYRLSFNSSLSELNGLKIFKREGIKKFYEECGDALVDRVIEGGLVVVRVEIKFSSEQTKNSFDLSAKLGFGNLLSLGANIQQEITDLKARGQVNVTAVQLGGENSQFSRLFPSGNSAECMGIVDQNVKETTIQINRCHEFLRSVSGYIRNDFPKQFADYRKGVFHAFNITTMDAAKNFESSGYLD